MMKLRIAGIILIIILNVLSLGITEDRPVDEVLKIGDYSYSFKEDGTIRIIEVFPDESEARIEGYVLDLDEGAMNYIPSSINGYPVTEIGDNALESLKILSWTIPGSIKKIGSYAFANSDVETIIMEEGVEELGDCVFANMVFKKIIIPSTVKKMGENPFCNCLAIDESSGILISPDNKNFSFIDGVLFDLDESRLVYYPHEIREKTYQIPVGTRIIGAYAFSGCSFLEEIVIPNSISTIGEYAFMWCEFQTINLPKGLSYIQDGTFYCCMHLHMVSIPSSVIKFGEKIFWKCNLVHLLVEEGSEAEEYAQVNSINYELVKKSL